MNNQVGTISSVVPKRRKLSSQVFDQTTVQKYTKLLTAGAEFLKYGRHGRPHKRLIKFSDNLLEMSWEKNEKNKKILLVKDFINVEEGCNTDIFKSYYKNDDISHLEFKCFSLIFSSRTIDLEAIDREQAVNWIRALTWLAKTFSAQKDTSDLKNVKNGKDISTPFNLKHVAHVDQEFQWQGKLEDSIVLVSKLGQGSFGSVYRGVQKGTGFNLAIKIFSEIEPNSLKDISREIEMLKTCRHLNIVSYYGIYQPYDKEDSLWILMDYCGAGTITDLVMRTPTSLPEEQLSFIFRCVLEALFYLHRKKIVHRDIKGANVFVTNDGIIKLGDFGLSSQFDLTHTGNDITSIAGSPLWMAPEVLKGQKPASYSDIWSLGITAIELADREVPYADLPFHALVRKITRPEVSVPTLNPNTIWSADFRNFVSCCLVRHIEERPTAEFLLAHPFITKSAGLKRDILQDFITRALTVKNPVYVSQKEQQSDDENKEGTTVIEENKESDLDNWSDRLDAPDDGIEETSGSVVINNDAGDMDDQNASNILHSIAPDSYKSVENVVPPSSIMAPIHTTGSHTKELTKKISDNLNSSGDSSSQKLISVMEEKPSDLVDSAFTAEPVKEEKKVEPIKEEKKPEPVKEEKKPEPVKEENKPEPVKEEKKVEPVKEEKKPEPVKEVKKPEPIKDQKTPSTEAKKVGHIKNKFEQMRTSPKDQNPAPFQRRVSAQSTPAKKEQIDDKKGPQKPAELQILLTLNEINLFKQKNHFYLGCCANCLVKINTNDRDSFRLCTYSQLKYCTRCHTNETSIIPYNVVQMSDFSTYPVSHSSKVYLSKMLNEPIEISKMNLRPLTYNSLILKAYHVMKVQLSFIEPYILTCPEKDNWLSDLKRFNFDIETRIDSYSIQELYNVFKTNTVSEVLHFIQEISSHIKMDCLYCKGRGYFCEYCKKDEILYAFDLYSPYISFISECFNPQTNNIESKKLSSVRGETLFKNVNFNRIDTTLSEITICTGCNSVYHLSEYSPESCPKCKRIRKRFRKKLV